MSKVTVEELREESRKKKKELEKLQNELREESRKIYQVNSIKEKEENKINLPPAKNSIVNKNNSNVNLFANTIKDKQTALPTLKAQAVAPEISEAEKQSEKPKSTFEQIKENVTNFFNGIDNTVNKASQYYNDKMVRNQPWKKGTEQAKKISDNDEYIETLSNMTKQDRDKEIRKITGANIEDYGQINTSVEEKVSNRRAEEKSEKINEDLKNGDLWSAAKHIGVGLIEGAKNSVLNNAGTLASLNGEDTKVKALKTLTEERQKTTSMIDNGLTRTLSGVSDTIGQMIPGMVTSTMGMSGNLVSALGTGSSTYMDNLNENNTNKGRALVSGLSSGGASFLSEKLTGGNILSKGALDDVATKWIGSNFSSKMGQKLVSKAYDVLGENAEELFENAVQYVTDAVVNQKRTTLEEMFKDTSETVKQTTLTTVILSMLGLGGDTYNKILENTDTETKQKITELNDIVNNEPKGTNNQLNTSSEQVTNDTNLSSLNQNVEGQNSKYEYIKSDNQKIEKLRQDIVNANWDNSKRTQNYVNMLEKIITDKDIEIRLDANLKTPNGQLANGAYKDDVITINPNSDRAGEFIAVHEVTHAIGTEQMKNIIQTYRDSNTEFDSDVNKLLENYKSADINEEALADISGQLFGNQEFINNVAQNNPNIFQKIYSEIKYLWHQFRGYKNQDQFIDDLYYKWTQAYNSNKKLNNTTNYSVIYNEDGSFNRVRIDDNIFENNNNQSISNTIKNYLEEHIGEYANIIESGQKVYLGKDLPGEYAYSKSTQRLPLSDKLAKGRASSGLKEIVENIYNRKYEANKKEKHNIDAKYGFYKYDTNFSFDYKGKEQIYKGTVVIRNDADGKKYLYDITNIKKIGNHLLPIVSNSEKSSTINSSSKSLPINSIAPNNTDVNTTTKYSIQESENNTTLYDEIVTDLIRNENSSGQVESEVIDDYVVNTDEYEEAEKQIEYWENNDIGYEENYLSDKINEIYDKIVDSLQKRGYEGRYIERTGKYVYDQYKSFKKGYDEILEFLDNNAIDYEISNSIEAGELPSIYVTDEEGNEFRIANHYNHESTAYDQVYNRAYSNNEYINWKDTILKDMKNHLYLDIKEFENNSGSFNLSENYKQQQLEIINKSNPADDDIHTWIRKKEDIKTFEEAFFEDGEYSGMDPDFDEDMAKESLRTGRITVYSSYPIENGTFVTPSVMEAEQYAGGDSGKLYSKEVNIQDIAWIDGAEGQYAKVDNTKYSKESQTWREYLESHFKATGTRTDMRLLPVSDTVRDKQKQELISKAQKIENALPNMKGLTDDLKNNYLQSNFDYKGIKEFLDTLQQEEKDILEESTFKDSNDRKKEYVKLKDDNSKYNKTGVNKDNQKYNYDTFSNTRNYIENNLKIPTREYFENKEKQATLTDKDYKVLNEIYEKEGKTDILPKKKNRKLNENNDSNIAIKQNEAEEEKGPTRHEVIQKNRELAREHIENISQWKDKSSGLGYQLETMERNMYDIIPDKEEARRINDTYFEPIHKSEAEKQKFINKYNDRIKEFNLNKYEAEAVQLLGEQKYNPSFNEDDVREIIDRVNTNITNKKIDRRKVDNAIETFRKTYDELFELENKVLKENGYKEKPYIKGYFPHFIDYVPETKSEKVLKALGFKIDKRPLPTDIAGITEQFVPGKTWNKSALQRKTNKTDYNALKGFDTYISQAADNIFHTENIQKLRALENEIRYQYSDKGVQERIDSIFNDDVLYEDEKQQQINGIFEQLENPMPNLVTELRRYTNALANKKSEADRSAENKYGRAMYNTVNAIENRFGANAVGLNIGSAVTNFIPITQAWSQVSTKNMGRAVIDTVKSYISDDNFIDKSTFLTNRLRQSEKLYKTTLDKISDKTSFLFNAIDEVASNIVVRGKYLENINNGMSENEAIKNADRFAANVISDRSKGSLPTKFEEKNPITKMITQFQLEVNNQYRYMFKDIPRDLADKGLGEIGKAFLKMFLGAWMYNWASEKITGRKAAFSPIDIAVSTYNNFADSDKGTYNKIADAVTEIGGELPFVGGLMGGGRVPVNGALPSLSNTSKAVTGLVTGEMDSKRAKESIGKELSKPLYYLLPPFGGAQIKKSAEGISTVAKGGSYGIDDKGNEILKFPVENKKLKDYVTAGIFGKYALPDAKTYTERSYKALNDKQTKIYKEANLPYKELTEYIDAQLKKNKDKIDYIESKDMTTEQKWGIYKYDLISNKERDDGESQLTDAEYIIKNGTNKEEYIDAFNKAVENDIEMPTKDKYIEMKESGITLKTYIDYKTKVKETTENKKENGLTVKSEDKVNILLESNYSNIEKEGIYQNYIGKEDNTYNIIKNTQKFSIDNYLNYKLQDFSSNKEDNGTVNGKIISGSGKTKFYDYMDSSYFTYDQKLLLTGMKYKTTAQERENIFDIVNEFNLSGQEKLDILKKMKGFTVYKDGTVNF